MDPGSQRVCHSQGSEVTEHTEPEELWAVSLSSDTYIQKTKKSYIDSRARRNLGSINTELQDVQRIMVANIEEVLQRGEALSGECLSSVFGSNVAVMGVFSVRLCLSCSFPTPLYFFLPLLSPPPSTRLQGQQLVQPVEKVQKRRQVSEYPLHLCQAGSWRCLFHHAHCLRTLLVALREEREKEGGGGAEVGKMGCTESADTKKSCHLRLKTQDSCS